MLTIRIFTYENEYGKSIIFNDDLPRFLKSMSAPVGKTSITSGAIGQDGISTLLETLNQRNIVCEFVYQFNCSAQEYRQGWIDICSILNPKLKGTITYTSDAGSWQIDVSPLETPLLENQHFSVTFVADYPYWRKTESIVHRFGTVEGGLTFPFCFDSYVTFGEWTNKFSYINDSGVDTPFEIVIESVGDYCQIINEKGEFIKVNKPLAAGQKLKINTFTNDVILVDTDGTETYANNYVVIDSNLEMILHNGENVLTFDNGLATLPIAKITINQLYVEVK